MDAQAGDEQTDLTNQSEDSSPGNTSLLSDSGRTERKRKRVRRQQKDGQSMNVEEPNAVGQMKVDQRQSSDARGTK